ncbi:MAG: hypothetical protein U0M60_20950, partial [Clostridia bacterium]|nr:hypothetical protein [Clostridia bacterium]
MAFSADKAIEEAKKEKEKAKQKKVRTDTVTRRYGSPTPTVAQVQSQAEAIASHDTDMDVTTFLNQAVSDGVVTSSEAESIFRKTTGGSLFSPQNQQKVTAETARRNNGGTPVWMDSVSEKLYGNYTSKQASEKLAELYSKESLTPQEKNDFNYLLGKTDSTTAKSYWERSKGEANEKWNDFSQNDELNLNSLEMTFPGAISAERDEKGKPIGYTLNVSELKNTYNLTDEDIKVITSKNGFVKSGEGKYYARLYGPKTNGFFKQVDYNNAASDAQEKKSIYEQLKWQEAVQPYIEEAKADPNYGSVPKQKHGKDNEYWLNDKSVWIADAIAGKADVSNYMNSMSAYNSMLPQGANSWGNSINENTKRKEILGEYDRIGQMTDEEKDVFLLWYNKDKEKAMEFYENLAPVLDKRVYVA